MDDECIEELGRPISNLKVTELRDELAKRALSKTGNKKELIDRLRADIQRQSSQRTESANIEQQQQQQQQQIPCHNPQFGLASLPVDRVEDNNQQIAFQTQMSTSIPTQYHQLPQQIQQQIIVGIQSNCQVPTENFQQQVSDLPDSSAIRSQPPPLDMRVQQSTIDLTVRQSKVQSLDLSTSVGVATRQEDKLLNREMNVQIETQIAADTSVPSRSGSPAEAEIIQEGHLSQKANDEPESTITDVEQSALKHDLEQPTSENLQEDRAQSYSEKTPDSAQEISKSVNEVQAPISLKRGLSDKNLSASAREKRRKWSTNPQPSQVKGEHQGGISSQKLLELIDVVPNDSKPEKRTTGLGDGPDKKDSTDDNEIVEEGQILEISGESAGASEEKLGTISGDPPQETNLDERKEMENEPESELEPEPSNVLLVQNLVRPFTINSLREVLTQYGQIEEDKFWTDKVKSKCCVVYQSIEVAKQTKESLNGQQWPPSNPKTLKVTFSNIEAFSEYQKSDLAKALEAPSTLDDVGENGGIDQGLKSMVDRLGERTDDKERGSDNIKKRLGERVPVDATSSSENREIAPASQELDDLFKKTKSVPHLFWLPLTEDQADIRGRERIERENRIREISKSRRSPPPRNRSPVRRISPPRNRPNVNRRSSPPRRRSPPRYRSPIRRRSQSRHRSPMRRRSPAPLHRSPNRRSPIRRSPNSMRRSPNLMRRSPNLMRRSPGLFRRSPALIRRSSPEFTRRSPETNRPGMIRRSPPPIRGKSRSPVRKRSPIRRRSPPRYMSPDRVPPSGYNSDTRRNQRPDRLR